MNKGYKFRIYPSAEQKIMFAKTFGCVRFVYNRIRQASYARIAVIKTQKRKI